MSNKLNIIQNYFESGLWSELQLQHAVHRGWITSQEYKTLTGNDYVNLATAPPTTLPEVSSADNGKVIKVVEGEWAKANNELVCEVVFSGSNSRIINNEPWEKLFSAIENEDEQFFTETKIKCVLNYYNADIPLIPEFYTPNEILYLTNVNPIGTYIMTFSVQRNLEPSNENDDVFIVNLIEDIELFSDYFESYGIDLNDLNSGDSNSDSNSNTKGLHIYIDYDQIDTNLTSPDEDWIGSSLFEYTNDLLEEGVYLHLENTEIGYLDPSLNIVPLKVDYFEHNNLSEDPNTWHLKAKLNIDYYNVSGIEDICLPLTIDITLTLEDDSIVWNINQIEDMVSMYDGMTYHFKIFDEEIYDPNWKKCFDAIIEEDYGSPFFSLYYDFTYYIFSNNAIGKIPLMPIDINREEGEEAITFYSIYPLGGPTLMVTVLKNQDPVDEYDDELLVIKDYIPSEVDTSALEAKIKELEAKVEYLTMVTGNFYFRHNSDWSQPIPMY